LEFGPILTGKRDHVVWVCRDGHLELW
jgi:hypothetical protein